MDCTSSISICDVVKEVDAVSSEETCKQGRQICNFARTRYLLLATPSDPFPSTVLIKNSYSNADHAVQERSNLLLVRQAEEKTPYSIYPSLYFSPGDVLTDVSFIQVRSLLLDTSACLHLPELVESAQVDVGVPLGDNDVLSHHPGTIVTSKSAISLNLVEFDLVSLYIQLQWTILSLAHQIKILPRQFVWAIEEAPFGGYFRFNFVLDRATLDGTRRYRVELKTRLRLVLADLFGTKVVRPIGDKTDSIPTDKELSQKRITRGNRAHAMPLEQTKARNDVREAIVLGWKALCDTLPEEVLQLTVMVERGQSVDEVSVQELKPTNRERGVYSFLSACDSLSKLNQCGAQYLSLIDTPSKNDKVQGGFSQQDMEVLRQGEVSLCQFLQREYLQWDQGDLIPPSAPASLDHHIEQLHISSRIPLDLPFAYVQPSKLPIVGAGLGLFAALPIPVGQDITEYEGVRCVSSTERPIKGEFAHTHIIALGFGTGCATIDGLRFPRLGKGAASLANSCYNGNKDIKNTELVKRRGKAYLVATRDIKVGEELIADYPFI